MPFAAIYIPDFPVEAIVRGEPELREQAVAVVEGTPPLLHVVAVNERAAQAGVEVGMTKLQAEERVDGRRSMVDGQSAASTGVGVVRQRSAEREAAAQAALLDCACGFSPRVEATAADTVVLDLAGLERIFGAPAKMARDMARRCSEMGLEANVAVASNVDTAVLAARGFAGVTVIADGTEAQRIGELSVEVLIAKEWSVRSRPSAATDVPLEGERAKSPAWANPGQTGAPERLEILETLERWGVRNLRALAALPQVAVAERLGQEGLRLQKLARGEVRRALVITEPPLTFEEAAELEYPVESLEALAFVLNRMLEQLCARLAARALATNEIKVRLELEADSEDLVIGRSDDHPSRPTARLPGTPDDRVIETALQIAGSPDHQITRCLRLPVAMLDAKVFLKLMQLDLQANSPQAAVKKVWLRAEPAEPRRVQNGLFAPEAPEAERLSVTLARIKRVVSAQWPVAGRQDTEARVGSPEILDTHRADGWRMNAFSPDANLVRLSDQGTRVEDPCHTLTALRVFRPAVAAVVTMKDGRPAQVASPDRPSMRGEVVWCAGPWRSSGEWWAEQVWSREEWDAAVKNEEGVVVYRIYRDEIGGKWSVEGMYD